MTRVKARRSSPPSGEQFEIRAGDHRAVVTEVGATLRSYTVDGHDVVDGFPVDETSAAGRGQVPAPWPNRLEDGRYTFEGREGAGLGRAGVAQRDPRPGPVAALGTRRAHGPRRRACLLAAPATRIPMATRPPGAVRAHTRRYGDDLDRLERVRRAGAVRDRLPSIPDARRGDRRSGVARACAGRSWATIALPAGDKPVAGTDHDFTAARVLGDLQLDTAFTDLVRDADGVTRVRLVRAQASRSTTVWMDDTFTHVMVYTGDTLEPKERRRHGIAIEPMTCPPNAFRSGVDVIRLEPAGSWRGRWGIWVEEGS